MIGNGLPGRRLRRWATSMMSPAFAALTVLLLGSLPTSAAHPVASQAESSPDWIAVELSTVGVDRAAGAPIVLLREPESGRIVPIWVGVAEAQAIARALHGVTVPRPMTHDLMASLLLEAGATVEEVIVSDFRESTYFGIVRLRLAGQDQVRSVDSRPSDALALALRTGAPIRVARKVLAAAPQFDFVAPDSGSQVVQVLGITVVEPTAELRKEFDLGDRTGVVVTTVAGRAREEGLRRGDLIVQVNGQAVREPIDLFLAIRATPAGESVRLTYWRQGEQHTIELPADLPPERPPDGRSLIASADSEPAKWSRA